MRDPLRPAGAANVGAAGLARTAPSGTRWEFADVVAYNSATHTALVRTHSGRPLPDVPQLKPTGGGYDHLETGTTVVISWDLGIPMIIGCVDFVGRPQAAIVPPTITGVEGYGDADPTQATAGKNSYKPPTAPTDMMPGDWAQVGSHGNHIAVLAGALTSLGSPTALLQSFGHSGTLRFLARRLETITDFGQWRAENDQGRTSLVLRAGSNQSSETGMDEENWTIRFDLGASGDVLDFSICEPKGKVLFRLHAGSDGRVQIYGDGGVDISSGASGAAETRNDIDGKRVVAVTGNDQSSVQGDQAESVDGNHSCEVVGDVQVVVGGSETRLVNGDAAHSVAGDALAVVTGSCERKVGEDEDVEIGGDSTCKVDGAIEVSAGKTMSMVAQERSRVDGRSVVLGASGRHPLPKFDVFLRDLSSCLSDVATAISNCTPSGASGAFAIAAALLKIQFFVIKASQGFPYESTKVRND